MNTSTSLYEYMTMTAGAFTVNIKQPNTEKNYTESKDCSKRSTHKKWILGFVGILSLVLVVAAITIAAVYFGSIFHKEAFKKFTKDRRTPEGVSYIEEFEVSSDEFIVNYTVGTAVFDRKRGLLIFKEKNGTSNCYVAPYNITDLPDSPLLEDILDTPDEDEAEMEQLTDYRIHPTGVIMAHKNTISPAANKICEGSAVEWAYLSKESGLRIQKRRAPPEFDIKITKDGCTITCTFEVGGAKFKISVDIPWSVLKKN